MTEFRRCPECGNELAADAPETPCPVCLMKLGLESWAERSASDARFAATQASQPESFDALQPADLANRFPELEILELLGQGGMGAVYKARQISLNRIVALKIIKPDVADDPDFRTRFTREAQALAKLSHPNIVTIHDFGQTDRLYHFIMEYVDGASLRQLLDAGNLEPRQALEVVPAICDALQFAHDEDIVHRDIKPENILIDTKGRVKIADFGLARLIRGSSDDLSLTGTRQVMGTPRYMAPEQMEGSRNVDHRADIYSVGVVFYEMLTGELPMGRFAPPSQKVEVDVRLDEVVLKTLEKEPARRYQQASAVRADVESITHTPAALRPREDETNGWAVLRQSFVVLLAVAGTLCAFMPWTMVNVSRELPGGGSSGLRVAAFGVQHWFPCVASLLSLALLFVTLSGIGRRISPWRAILGTASGLALVSLSLFTIWWEPLTVHAESFSAMVTDLDEWSAHVPGGTTALAELVRLDRTGDRIRISAEPFVGSWLALGVGLVLLLHGLWELRETIRGSVREVMENPLSAVQGPAWGLRVTGLLGPAGFIIVFLMIMIDLAVNGGGAPSHPMSLLRKMLIAAFFVHLASSCFVSPWILFGASRMKTLAAPRIARTACVLAMLPLSFSAFVGLPVGLWALMTLRGHESSSVNAK